MTTPTADSTTRLYLVRHGATDANLKRPYVLQGCSVNLSLSEVGRKQAAAVAEFLKSRKLVGVYSSPLKRAVETGQFIAAQQRLTVEPVEDLHECDVGQWEGLDWATIQQRHPEAHSAFLDDPESNPYLGGESYGAVLQRSRGALRALLERHPGQEFAVVGHNVVNRVLLADALGLDLKRARHLKQQNGCINVLEHSAGQTTVITLNAIFHLDGLED